MEETTVPLAIVHKCARMHARYLCWLHRALRVQSRGCGMPLAQHGRREQAVASRFARHAVEIVSEDVLWPYAHVWPRSRASSSRTPHPCAGGAFVSAPFAKASTAKGMPPTPAHTAVPRLHASAARLHVCRPSLPAVVCRHRTAQRAQSNFDGFRLRYTRNNFRAGRISRYYTQNVSCACIKFVMLANALIDYSFRPPNCLMQDSVSHHCAPVSCSACLCSRPLGCVCASLLLCCVRRIGFVLCVRYCGRPCCCGALEWSDGERRQISLQQVAITWEQRALGSRDSAHAQCALTGTAADLVGRRSCGLE